MKARHCTGIRPACSLLFHAAHGPGTGFLGACATAAAGGNARHLYTVALEPRGPHAAGAQSAGTVAGGRDLESVAALLRPLVLLAQGRSRPAPLLHVPAAQPACEVHA